MLSCIKSKLCKSASPATKHSLSFIVEQNLFKPVKMLNHSLVVHLLMLLLLRTSSHEALALANDLQISPAYDFSVCTLYLWSCAKIFVHVIKSLLVCGLQRGKYLGLYGFWTLDLLLGVRIHLKYYLGWLLEPLTGRLGLLT